MTAPDPAQIEQKLFTASELAILITDTNITVTRDAIIAAANRGKLHGEKVQTRYGLAWAFTTAEFMRWVNDPARKVGKPKKNIVTLDNK